MTYPPVLMRQIIRVLSVSVISLSLSLVVTPSFASKSPKPGAKCPQAKITQVFNGKLHTCVKSKGRLVWNKGVRIKGVPFASVSPIATPTPSATSSPSPISTPTNSPSATPSPTSTSVLYTIESVRANNSVSSCWTIIDGFVYDLTKWISLHPGGPIAIRSLCGVDGTASFKGQHQNQADPTRRLSSYLLGPLSR